MAKRATPEKCTVTLDQKETLKEKIKHVKRLNEQERDLLLRIIDNYPSNEMDNSSKILSCSLCDDTHTDSYEWFVCDDCHNRVCESCENDMDDGITREFHHIFEEEDPTYPPWTEFLDREDLCYTCWIKHAHQILTQYKEEKKPENRCSKCNKDVPEIGLSRDGYGYFSRSECYQCEPLHKCERRKHLSPIDALLETTGKMSNT